MREIEGPKTIPIEKEREASFHIVHFMIKRTEELPQIQDQSEDYYKELLKDVSSRLSSIDAFGNIQYVDQSGENPVLKKEKLLYIKRREREEEPNAATGYFLNPNGELLTFVLMNGVRELRVIRKPQTPNYGYKKLAGDVLFAAEKRVEYSLA